MNVIKSIIITFSILFVSGLVFGQQEDIYHENGKIAYDVSFGTVYFSNQKQAFAKRFKNVFYPNGKKAYEARYKNIYYKDGSVAYNNVNKNLYYPNGALAYSPNQKVILDDQGQILKELKSPTDSYTISEDSLKVTISQFRKYEFELIIPDENYTYMTDFTSYFKIKSNSDGSMKAEIKY